MMESDAYVMEMIGSDGVDFKRVKVVKGPFRVVKPFAYNMGGFSYSNQPGTIIGQLNAEAYHKYCEYLEPINQ